MLPGYAEFLTEDEEPGKAEGLIGSTLVLPVPLTVVKFIINPRPGMETLGSELLREVRIAAGSVPGERNSPGVKTAPAGGTHAASTHVNADSISPLGGIVFNGNSCPTANVVPEPNVVPS